MSKKQHHKKQLNHTAPASVAAAPAAPVAAAPRVVLQRAPVAVKPKAVVTWQELAPRYQHVNDELKQIGILAGSFLVVLLVLWGILG